MQRRVEQRERRRYLDQLARIHDGESIRQFGDDAQVVRDEDQGHVVGVLELLDQIQDLSFNDHV